MTTSNEHNNAPAVPQGWTKAIDSVPLESDGEVFIRFTDGSIGTGWATYWHGASNDFARWTFPDPDEFRLVSEWAKNVPASTGMHWTENEPVRLPHARTGRVYLAGPMTGISELNFPAFNQEAERLRAEGLQVLNPADHGIVDGADWADYLRHDIAGLASCERIHLLRGWTKSKGACLEMTIAKALLMTVTYQVDAEMEHNNAPAVPQGYEIHEIPADYSGLVWLEGQVRAVARRAQAATGPQGWTDADSDAARLALELECLLMDTKNLSVVSKWWDSANDALELHRQRLAATTAPAPAAGILDRARRGGQVVNLMRLAEAADKAAASMTVPTPEAGSESKIVIDVGPGGSGGGPAEAAQPASDQAVPSGEVVAWMVYGNYTRQPFWMLSSAEAYMRGLLKSDPDGGYHIRPLRYATPAPAQEPVTVTLTDEERADMACAVAAICTGTSSRTVAATAIEWTERALRAKGGASNGRENRKDEQAHRAS